MGAKSLCIWFNLQIDSYNSLPMEKALTFHKAIILIKSVIDINKKNCYYNIFL